MVHIDSILAATDFSADARNALERAAMLCTTTGATRGAALHVLETSWLEALRQRVSSHPGADQSLIDSASRDLEQLVAEIREATGGSLEPQVRVGNVVDTIVEACGEYDVLALGARGGHTLREFALGTTAERIIRRIPKPILVVRRKAAASYRRVLVAVDFSRHSQAAFEYANLIAPDGELHLVHVFGVLFEGQMRYTGVSDALIKEYRDKARAEAELAMSRFASGLGQDEHRVKGVVEYGGHVANTLVEKARDLDADLVVVGKHGESLTEGLLLGGVTLRMLGDCSCDVLVAQ